MGFEDAHTPKNERRPEPECLALGKGEATNHPIFGFKRL